MVVTDARFYFYLLLSISAIDDLSRGYNPISVTAESWKESIGEVEAVLVRKLC